MIATTLRYIAYLQKMDTTSSEGEKLSAMTWLQAAERVLCEEGPAMHIRDLTRRIMELGMVNSSCTTSLETLLYRQTSRGNAKFVRVAGKMGWFGLKAEGCVASDTDADSLLGCREDRLQERCAPIGTGGGAAATAVQSDTENGGEFEPHPFYMRKRRQSYGSESDSSSYFSSGSDDGEESETSSDGMELEPDSEALYRKKYHFVKQLAKGMIYENAALADQLDAIEEKIAKAEVERRFLLRRLGEFKGGRAQPMPRSSTKNAKLEADASDEVPKLYSLHDAPIIQRDSPPTQQPRKPLVRVTPAEKPVLLTRSTGLSTIAVNTSTLAVTKTPVVQTAAPKGLNTVSNLVTTGLNTNSPAPNVSVHLAPPAAVKASEASLSSSSDSEQELTPSPVLAIITSNKGGRSPSEKGRKDWKSKRKSRRLYPVPVNEAGSPILPIQIRGLRVNDLGKIVYDRPAYHSERYLLPVGFESSRDYPSMTDPSKKTSYTCRILDNGEAPIFEMVASDDPSNPVRASSSTACQTLVLKAINKARDKQATNSGSGPEFFGYSNPTILNLLQKLPDAEKCSKYNFMAFEEPPKRKTGQRQMPKLKKAKKSSATLKKDSPSISATAFYSSSSADLQSASSSADIPKSKSLLDSPAAVAVPTKSDPSLAPVLGSGLQQFGLETGSSGLYSSSEEWSFDSEDDVDG